MKSMHPGALLPFFRPPTESFGTESTEVRSVSPLEVENIWDKEGLEPPMYGFELSALHSKDGGKLGPYESARHAAVYTTRDIPWECFTALADLVSRNWRYIQERSKALASRSLGGPYPKTCVLSFTSARKASYTAGLHLLEISRPFRIAMLRWSSGLNRMDPLDSVLDYCSALEALFRLPDELRLRLALCAYHVVDRGKRDAYRIVYEMYGIRSKFIHGGVVPELPFESAAKYGATVTAVLNRIIAEGTLPSREELDSMTHALFGNDSI